MSVDSMLLATPSPLSLGGRLRAVGLGCDGKTEVVVDVTDRGLRIRELVADVARLEAENRILRAIVEAQAVGEL